MSKIPSALTPEEWRKEMATLANSQGVDVRAFTHEGKLHLEKLQVRRPHGLAALALYGQPFGFRRDEVFWLYSLASVLRFKRMEADANQLEAFAGKIASLLPPEESELDANPASQDPEKPISLLPPEEPK